VLNDFRSTEYGLFHCVYGYGIYFDDIVLITIVNVISVISAGKLSGFTEHVTT